MNTPLALSACRSSCAAIGDDPLTLTRIFEPEIQLAQWSRPPALHVEEWLTAHRLALGCGLRQTLAPGQAPDLNYLPAGRGRDALAEDIGLLSAMLAELLDAKRIGLRIEIVREAMCPRLHVDHVGIRLLCTYLGPGTEWVEDSDVDRRFLGAAAGGKPDEASGLLLPDYRIKSIPAHSVALLKGSLWQGNTGRGIVHRSPAVSTPPRVLLALDAGWDD